LNKKLIRNISWVSIFLFIYQWCGVRTVYAVDTSVVIEIDSTVLGSTKLNSYINSKITEGYTKFYIKDGPPYQLDDSIIINKPNVEIKGESKTGTILFLKSDTNVGGIVNAHGIVIESGNIELSNFQFDAMLGLDAIRAEDNINVNNIKISNCDIKKSAGNSAISFLNKTSTKNLNNCIVDNNITTDPSKLITAEDAIIFENQKNGNIINNQIDGGKVNIRIGDDLIVSGNTITSAPISAGIKATVPLNNIEISYNTIENTKKAGISVFEETNLDDDNIRYDKVKIIGNTIKESEYFGIEVRNLKNAVISDNTISHIDYQGIYLLYSDNVTVENNSVSDYARGNANADWNDKSSGIFLDYKVKNTKIMSNIISNDKLYGIRIQDGGSNINNTIYSDNIISGNLVEYIQAKIQSPQYTNILEKDTVTDNSISLKWIEMYKNAKYDLKVDGVVVAPPIGAKLKYEHTGLTSDTEHKYQISIEGSDNWSNEMKIKTLSIPPPPPPIPQLPTPIQPPLPLPAIIPQNIRATSTKNTITINWDEVDELTEYEIEVDGEIISVGTNEKYKHQGLKSNSKHRYRVRVKGGEWSSVLIAKTSNSTSSSKGRRSNNENNEFDKLEIYFGNKRNLNDKNPLFENVQVDMLNRLFICNFEENYYLGIRAWKDNKLKREIEYKINLTPENKLTFNKIDDKVNNINYEIKEILIQDTVGHIFYVNDFENITLSKYTIDNGYVISVDDIKMKSKKNEKYIISESFIR
jgi:parallel beta-helix repeat protein